MGLTTVLAFETRNQDTGRLACTPVGVRLLDTCMCPLSHCPCWNDSHGSPYYGGRKGTWKQGDQGLSKPAEKRMCVLWAGAALKQALVSRGVTQLLSSTEPAPGPGSEQHIQMAENGNKQCIQRTKEKKPGMERSRHSSLVLGRLRQKNPESEAKLSSIVEPLSTT